MKKALLTMALLLVPFLSLANIFEDGSVYMQEPVTTPTALINCSIGSNLIGTSTIQSLDPTPYQMDLSCVPVVTPYLETHPSHTSCTPSAAVSVDSSSTETNVVLKVSYPYKDFRGLCLSSTEVSSTYSVSSSIESIDEIEECDEGLIDYQSTNDGLKCFDASDAILGDSCNINDSPNVQVTDEKGCYTKSDRSMCSVTAVDVGGGNQVYQGSEGNCYADPQPDVTDNTALGEPNPDGTCTNNGGLLVCPEDPDNVCNESGSTYGGGSVNNCQSGCGYVNDAFQCYDEDTDSDGLPDYNDPDIDGDGVANADDLDADGDGQDDPINGDGNTGGGGEGLDLSPVVSELKKTNTKLDDVLKQFKPEPKPDDLDFTEQTESHKQAIIDYANKTPAELGYIVQFDKNQISGYRNFENAISENVSKCKTFEFGFPRLSYTMTTIDMCKVSEKVEPILYWIFAMLTIIYCLNQFSATIQGL